MAQNNERSAPQDRPQSGPGFGGGRGGGGGGRMRIIEKPRDFKTSFFRLMTYLSPYKLRMGIMLMTKLIAIALTTAIPYVMAYATNEMTRVSNLVITVGSATLDMTLLVNILLSLAVLYVVSAVINYINRITITSMINRMMYELRRQIDEKVTRLPLSYFDTHPYGDTLSRVTNDVDSISNSLNQSFNQAINAVFSIVMVAAVMLWISPTLTVAGLIIMPLGALVSMWVIKFSQKYFRGQQRHLGMLNGYIEEMYSNQNVIKAYGQEQNVVDEFANYNKNLYDYMWKAQFCASIIMPFVQFLTNLGYVAVVVLGSAMVVAGNLLVGDIQALTQYMRQFSQPVAMLTNVFNTLQSAVAAGERIFGLLDQPEEKPNVKNVPIPDDLEGRVSFNDVHFSYVPGTPIITGLNAQINPGEMIAIVGPTGAGKTTLVNLLLRFYDLDSGAITIDGLDISHMDRVKLRNHFGMVLQDTWLFKGTIMDNIRYGSTEATEEEVIAAAKSAYAHRFIQQLPGGYNFELAENATNVSQGQRQLLTIARALLANPDILILDEATSSVDTRTELLIQRAMYALMKNRTSFVIAHRLSTIRDANKILVVNAGNVVEIGNHEELLEAKGYYYNLYNSQFMAPTA